MLVVWKMRTHLVACSVCCRCATCRRLIRTGDTDVCRYTRPNQESVTALLAGERLEGYLLGVAPTKAAAQNSFVPSLLAALLMTGTFGLALATGGQGTGAATAVERNGVFGRSGCKQPSRSRAAGKFRSPPLSMIC